jgi:4-aminobutyrate aminotransferase/(S)-3-amino-2-methylpropionate transaminase
MGPRRSPGTPGGIVLSSGQGSNVLDVDGNRYVDLAAGFGALLLGHGHPNVLRAVEMQSARLLQALGDVYPSDAKIGLLSRLAELHPAPHAQCILGQSGSDAVSAALKTAALVTGRPGVVAFEGAYHGLGYGPLGALGLRASYRAPFAAQLNPHVHFAPFPASTTDLERSLTAVHAALGQGDVGAILIEPILGRGGVLVPPDGFLPELRRLARDHGALFIADEVWTGLGRSGHWLAAVGATCVPDLVCLGKGLGGGLPLSACIGPADLMAAWSREAEVVHTATFAGAPLACAASLATLDVLHRHGLVARAASVGARWRAALTEAVAPAGLEVRGAGLMVGIDVATLPGGASILQRRLLEAGYVTSTGGGARDVLVLTPPLTISESLLDAFTAALTEVVARS